MNKVLEERGINTACMLAEDMQTVLSFHDDFQNEKTIVELSLSDRGHIVMFVPKFHLRLTPLSVFGDKQKYTVACIQISLSCGYARSLSRHWTWLVWTSSKSTLGK